MPWAGQWAGNFYPRKRGYFSYWRRSRFSPLPIGSKHNSVCRPEHHRRVRSLNRDRYGIGRFSARMGRNHWQRKHSSLANFSSIYNSFTGRGHGDEHQRVGVGGQFYKKQRVRGLNTASVGAGSADVAIGQNALSSLTGGGSNTAIGNSALFDDTTGQYDVAIGSSALAGLFTAQYDTAVGTYALYQVGNGNNTGVGAWAGAYYTGTLANYYSANSVFVGYNTMAYASSDTNETVIGYNAVGNGSNTTTLGNSSITATYYFGSLNNANGPVIPISVLGNTGNSAGYVELVLTGTTGTITGTTLTASCDSGTASVPGAIVGHPVAVSSATGVDLGAAFSLRASVTSTGTVTVYVCAPVSGTPASLAYNVWVL